jgi:hypothetical protein
MSANCLSVFVSHLYVSLLYVVSQKVVSPLKVSHSFVEDWIFCYRDGTGVVAYDGNSLKAHSKSLMVCTIDRIWEQHLAAGTYSASVVDRATEDCFQEDQQIREDPKKWQVPSHNPQNQHKKSQQDPAKKKQNTKSQT